MYLSSHLLVCVLHQGVYQGVFPVKCNHDRRLLETVVNYGKPTHFGLEAGSKPELLLAVSLLQQAGSDGLLICNGYKDEAYIETVLLTSQLNNACIMLVLEKLEELTLILEVLTKPNPLVASPTGKC
jgi:arginine decarboxylase